MRFRTELIPDKYKIRFDYRKRYFFIGSCFADNIGTIMQRNLFSILSNPFGTVFNTSSIAKQLAMLEDKERPSLNFNTETQLYFDYNLHSSFSRTDSKLAKEEISKAKEEAYSFIKKTDVAIITLGTAWVYRLKENDNIVANCHKMPQRLFDKEIMPVSEIIKNLHDICSLLLKYNSKIDIVFTLSPVRHIKDGLTENSLSKARLLTAIHEVVDEEKNIHYFPSYEIMMDDLRDYRFYNQDLIHPNNMAIDYIWNKLMDGYFDEDTKALFYKVSKIKDFLEHRPIDPLNPKYLLQKEKQELDLEALIKAMQTSS
jgi:lysophospholipase L1-like esterase